MPESQCMCKEKTLYQAAVSMGLQFRDFCLEDKTLIDSYTKPWASESSDLSFANLYIWGTEGKMQFAEFNEHLYIKLNFKGVPNFLWAPIPKFGTTVAYRDAVCAGICYMESIGVEPTFRSVSDPFYSMLKNNCPELFEMPTDIASDYIYERESLATLKGKKLHGKRNHINKFLSLYPDYEYRKLEPSMVEDCIALYDQWTEEKDVNSSAFSDERKSVVLALRNLEALGLVGGTIFVDNTLIAFTVGERLLPHVQLIHIEKANFEYEGVFPMINQQYVLHECEGVELINREEDMGIPGMRKAKRSYNPIKMVDKYMFGLRDLTTVKGLWGKSEEE